MAEQTMTAPTLVIPDRVPSEDAVAASTERGNPLSYRRSPGAGLTELMAAGSGQTVRLREVQFLTQLSLRASSASAVAALGEALGAPLPDRVGAVSSGVRGPNRPVDILWLSPDEWLAVLGDEAITGESARALVAAGSAALAGHRGQIVDVSANRATLELSGPDARTVLDKVIQLDLHPREFPVGRAVSTLLEFVPVILWRTGEDTWLVLPRSSFTEFIAGWLLDGMREFR